MKCVTYNIFGGMKGNAIMANMKHHYYLYAKRAKDVIKEKTKDLSKVNEMIKESNADLICINEVIYELQKEKLTNFLKSIGYKAFSIGKSSDREDGLDLCTVLASKYEGNEIIVNITKGKSIINEGSFCVIDIEKENLIVIGIHLALSKKIRLKQLTEISDFIAHHKNSGRNIVLMGDFNEPIKKLNKHKKFKELGMQTKITPTFPSIKLLKWFKRDYDHIFHTLSNTDIETSVKEGDSDHFMLRFDFFPKPKESFEINN